MLKESTEALNIQADGTYVDTTFGGGGHSREILSQLKGGKLYAFDQDDDSPGNEIEDEQFTFIQQNFSYLSNFLKMYQAIPIDGLIADLGISSHQIDIPERGFAFRFDGPLDMRMNQKGELTAAKIVQSYSESELTDILRLYGELKNARRIAQHLIRARDENPFQTTGQLIESLKELAPPRAENKFYAKVFQALRIEVNGELEVLKSLLEQCTEVIKEGGRIAIITYHSLEDRIVKNFIRSGHFDGKIEKDFYGNVMKPFEAINRKPILPSAEEIEKNNRARSAKLRVAARTEYKA